MSNLKTLYANWRKSHKNTCYTAANDPEIKRDFAKFAKLEKELEDNEMLELEKDFNKEYV